WTDSYVPFRTPRRRRETRQAKGPSLPGGSPHAIVAADEALSAHGGRSNRRRRFPSTGGRSRTAPGCFVQGQPWQSLAGNNRRHQRGFAARRFTSPVIGRAVGPFRERSKRRAEREAASRGPSGARRAPADRRRVGLLRAMRVRVLLR